MKNALIAVLFAVSAAASTRDHFESVHAALHFRGEPAAGGKTLSRRVERTSGWLELTEGLLSDDRSLRVTHAYLLPVGAGEYRAEIWTFERAPGLHRRVERASGWGRMDGKGGFQFDAAGPRLETPDESSSEFRLAWGDAARALLEVSGWPGRP